MGRPAKTAVAEPKAEETYIEGEEVALEPFQEPVPVITPKDPTPDGLMKVRVLPKGDGRVATGHFDRAENKFTYHAKGDHLFLSPDLARTQEDAGLVEIVSGG
jgi:hypothetical protein